MGGVVSYVGVLSCVVYGIYATKSSRQVLVRCPAAFVVGDSQWCLFDSAADVSAAAECVARLEIVIQTMHKCMAALLVGFLDECPYIGLAYTGYTM